MTERKRIGDEKEVFILPANYKIVNNNPIVHSYLIYRRSISESMQCAVPWSRPSKEFFSKNTLRTGAG